MDWMNILYDIFDLCVIPLLGILTYYITQYIKVKANEITTNSNNELVSKYVNSLKETITSCVIATNQTYVESLKNQGKFDKEAQKKAFEMTYDAVMAILSDEAKVYLTEIYGDLTAYITSRIEAEVKVNK